MNSIASGRVVRRAPARRAGQGSNFYNPRRGNRQVQQRKLMRWNEDLDQQLLLAIDATLKEYNVRVDWDMVASRLPPPCTAGACEQHISKLRKVKEELMQAGVVSEEQVGPNLIDYAGGPKGAEQAAARRTSALKKRVKPTGHCADMIDSPEYPHETSASGQLAHYGGDGVGGFELTSPDSGNLMQLSNSLDVKQEPMFESCGNENSLLVSAHTAGIDPYPYSNWTANSLEHHNPGYRGISIDSRMPYPEAHLASTCVNGFNYADNNSAPTSSWYGNGYGEYDVKPQARIGAPTSGSNVLKDSFGFDTGLLSAPDSSPRYDRDNVLGYTEGTSAGHSSLESGCWSLDGSDGAV